ncbi:MAG: hypothetical protein JW741_00565 [Sedimentisphaerales bacterium]|nr:hypothetical protein [Sedimentisphaerales bacterium]
MSKRKRSVGLLAFLRGSTDPAAGMPGCANYDSAHGGCLLGDHCTVEQGQRCGFFERAVLPTAADIGLSVQIHAQYARQVGLSDAGELGREPSRSCPDCGAELKPRQRYCDTCSARRRRDSYRRARQKAVK